MYLKVTYSEACYWAYDYRVLSRLICIILVRNSNSSHNAPRKEEFHAILRAMNTFCCGLTSILWRSQILEVIEISLKNLTKSNPLIEGDILFFFLAILRVPM